MKESKAAQPTQQQSIVDRVKGLRKKRQLTQSALAARLGLTQSIISTIESGSANISVGVLQKLSREFKVSLEWLIHGSERFTKVSAETGFMSFVSAAETYHYINKLPEDRNLFLPRYRLPEYKEKNYQIFEIDNNSMIPAITPGDYLIAQQVSSEEITEGHIHILVTNKNLHIGRLYRAVSSLFSLKFDNRDWIKKDIPADNVMEFWKVKQRITTGFVDSTYQYFQRIEEAEKEVEKIKNQLQALSQDAPNDPG